jgi:hydrogenase nickel incorporation protein HypA/HybF
MHELAVTESVVAAIAERLPGVAVRRVRVRVGALSGVVPDAMRFCFDLATLGTPLEGAELVIEPVLGRGRCRDCGAEFDTDDLLAVCGCGGIDVEVVGGRDLTIRDVEVV